MPTVEFVRDDGREVYFAQPRWGRLILAAALCYLFQYLAPNELWRWRILSLGLPIFLGMALWRYELRLDTFARMYRLEGGFWPFIRLRRGSFDELVGIVLDSGLERGDDTPGTVWRLKFLFRGDSKPVQFLESGVEEKVYQELEKWSKRLQLPAVDRTGEAEKVLSWGQLDESLAEREHTREREAWTRGGVPLPPVGSRIEVSGPPGAQTLVLPSAAVRGRDRVVIGVGLWLAAGGAFMLYAKLRGMPIQENPSGAVWVVGPVVILLGLAMMIVGWLSLMSREVVREDAGQLVIGSTAFGRTWMFAQHRLPKSGIKEVEIKFVAGTRASSKRFASLVKTKYNVCVRSDSGIAHIGPNLSTAEQTWLRDAIKRMALR